MRIALAAVCLAPALLGQFRAGAAKSAITPDLNAHGPVYMAGFGNNRVAQGVHDDLYARCVAMSAGARPLVICEADLIGLFVDDTDRIRAEIRKSTPDADVVIASTHVHEGPDTMGQWGPGRGVPGINDAYMAFLHERIGATALSAVKSMKPADIRLAVVKSKELDAFIDDDRPPITHDSSLILMRLTDASGTPIANVVNWANHPETLGSKNTQITADYPYYLCSKLEKELGGVAALWNGAVGGMQSTLGSKVTDPADGKEAADGTFRKAELIGNRVAELAAAALKTGERVTVDRIVFRETRVAIPMTNPNFQAAAKANAFKGRKIPNADGATTAPVGFVRLSRSGRAVLEIALIPGEMYPELSTGAVERYAEADYPDAPIEPAIKPMMTAPYRMLIGLANDEIGYIIPKSEWDEKPPYLNGAKKKHYGEVNSVGPDAAPIIADAMQKLTKP